MICKIIVLALLFIFEGVAMSGLVFQDVSVSAQTPIRHNVSVTMKLIQVYVTDKDGASVKDLKKADFILSDNGEERTISEFERHTIDLLSMGRSGLPEGRGGVPTASLPSPRLGRRFFLFFDFAYNTSMGILRAKKAALHFIETGLLPTDEVGVVSYSAIKGLVLNESLSLDHNKILKCISQFGLSNTDGAATDVEEAYLRQLESTEDIFQRNRLEWERIESKNLARNYIENLTAFSLALGYLSGQKQIVFFSSGFPATLIDGVIVSPRVGASGIDTLLARLKDEMLKTANAANCTFFTFDTRGGESDLFSKDKAAFEDRTQIVRATPNTRTNINPSELTGMQTLRDMAFSTGGKYLGDVDNYRQGFDMLQNLTGTYYVLGYTINERWDGRYHKIKVNLRKSGYKVHTQAGYFNPKPFYEYSDMEKKLHLFDLALSDEPMFQIPLRFSLMPVVYGEGGILHLRILSKISLEIIETFGEKKAEMIAFAFDHNDRLAGMQRTTIDLSQFKGRDVFFSARMIVPPGTYKCRVVVRNLESGSAALASTNVYIPPLLDQGLRFDTPLLLRPSSNAFIIESASSKTKDIEQWNRIYPFDQSGWAPIIGEIFAGSETLRLLVPYTMNETEPSKMSLKTYLINAINGGRIEPLVSVLSNNRRGSRGGVLMEISFADVPVGKYSLYIHSKDTVSNATAYIQIPLSILPLADRKTNPGSEPANKHDSWTKHSEVIERRISKATMGLKKGEIRLKDATSQQPLRARHVANLLGKRIHEFA